MTTWNPNILNDPIGAGLEMQFGFPKCLTDLTKDLLSLLPGDVLGGLAAGMAQGRANARNALGNTFEKIHNNLGILEYNSDTGKLSLFGDSSDSGVNGFFNTVGAGIGIFQEFYKAQQSLGDDVQSLVNCINDYLDYLEKGKAKVDPNDAASAEEQLARTKGQFLVLKAQAQTAEDYIDKVNGVLNTIGEILLEREEDPSTIPNFIVDDQGDVKEEESPIFRLTFGPPKAKKGSFLLSVDGLYYDSQSRVYEDGSPIPTVKDLEVIPAKDRWLLDHSPNLGGRGTSYSSKDLNDYVGTLFDLDAIDNTDSMKEYYDADEFLQTLEAQRITAVSNLNKNLDNIDYGTYGRDSAIYINYLQQIKTENSAYQSKINKRKKQIEVAVKAPDLFGVSSGFSKNNIPVNDFTFLSSVNLSVEIEKQQNLVFDHGEISGLVLPLTPKFVTLPSMSPNNLLTPLRVSESGIGSYIEGDELESKPVLSITTGITTKGLKAIYPFTTGRLQTPSSDEFTSKNTATYEGGIDDAQLVSNNPNLLFTKGIGLPFLTGLVSLQKEDSNYEFKGETWDSYPFEIGSQGSYVKLPDSDTFQNLLYSNEGATISLWTYIPGLFSENSTTSFPSHPYSTSSFDFNLSSDSVGSVYGKWCDLQYYRVLLGCENTGGKDLNLDQSSVSIDRSSNNVRGMLMGFSREPRMYYQDSGILPGSTDLNPRENFGGYIDSLSSTVSGSANGIEGVWQVSSSPTNPQPIAARQASGTFKTKNINGVSRSYDFTVTDPGDKYTTSSHEACCVLYTSGSKGATNYVTAVSAGLSIAPFNGNYLPGATSSVFFIAPTQSYNTSSVGFVKNASCRTDPDAEILRFVVSTKDIVDGVDFSDISSKFVNLQVVFDPPNDSLKLYVNGVLFKESLLSTVFGVEKGTAPQLPSFIYPQGSELSSFYYSKSTVNQAPKVTAFDEGPDNYPLFTPWVVGGGWTDGRPVNLSTSSGGFLDTGAGLTSAYNGHIGSLKFYDRALNITEVKTNYNAQKGFFEEIDL